MSNRMHLSQVKKGFHQNMLVLVKGLHKSGKGEEVCGGEKVSLLFNSKRDTL